MLHLINITENSKIPKYMQIINAIHYAVDNNEVMLDDKLPSINDLLIEFDISRDTIVRAYDKLKKMELIDSVPGKGYYIKKNGQQPKEKVFFLFNDLSAQNKTIYDAFIKELGNNVAIDSFVYNDDYFQFKNHILAGQSKNYTHYVIICHFGKDCEDFVNFIVNEIPLNKLVILGKKVNELVNKAACVYQDFERDIFSALVQLNSRLKKYKQINLLLGKWTYSPKEIQNGFIRFCTEQNFDYRIVDTIENEGIEINTTYVTLTDDDLVSLIKKIKSSKYTLGKDVGIISYNDTPLKEFLVNGVTIITTDFSQMGKQSAQLILNYQRLQYENPFYVIHRNSL